VLFSEPKIPQCSQRNITLAHSSEFQCSSASRKFLNRFPLTCCLPVEWFQCSSASRKFLNNAVEEWRERDKKKFQCSSASRKFLNRTVWRGQIERIEGFSALQRAENSSIGVFSADVWK